MQSGHDAVCNLDTTRCAVWTPGGAMCARTRWVQCGHVVVVVVVVVAVVAAAVVVEEP